MKLVSKRKMLAAALTVSFLMQQSVMLGAFATDISGIQGNNGVYDILPSDKNGDIGFRKYQNFTLSEGDIANLIFKFGRENVSKFVNLVDNTININGIVNTMRDGNFYNGHAVFISPNGMVVGASGVLNVGALSVYTPAQSDYKRYIDNNYTGDISSLQKGTANVTVNGKVISRGDINVIAKDATVTANGALFAGVQNADLLTSQGNAEILFNALVNTDNLSAGNTLALENGNIVIKTENRDGGINIAGLVRNDGKGDITLFNNGTKDLRVVGKIQNTKGNVSLTDRQSNTVITGEIINNDGKLNVINNAGELLVGSNAVISNKGEMRLVNRGENGLNVNGTVANDGLTLLSSNAGNIVINGKIQNQNGRLTIVSNGDGLEVGQTGEISSNNEIKIGNTGADGFVMNGKVSNSGSTALTNWQGDFIIGGTVENENGKMNLSNAGPKMHLTKTSKIVNNGDLQIINSGREGLTLDGLVENKSTTNIWSVRGDLDVNGSVTNQNGKLTITNDGNALNVGENALISNDSSTVITNTGSDGLEFNGLMLSTGSAIIDNQAGDVDIKGSLVQSGNKLVIKNSGDGLYINGAYDEEGNYSGAVLTALNSDVTIFNTGNGGTNIIGGVVNSQGDANTNISVVNKAGNLNVQNAYLRNENGNVSIVNSGNGIMYLRNNTQIENLNGKVGIVNTAEKGAQIDAHIINNGITNITNRAGQLEVGSRIDNSNGKLEIVNNGKGLVISDGAVITNNSDIKIANTGENGMYIAGKVYNNGSTAVSNWNGDMVISGTVANNGDKMNITSAQNSNGLYLTKEGQILNNGGELYIQNTGANGMRIDGEVNNDNTTTLYNLAGNMDINGVVQNKGELMISNRGQNLTVGSTAIVKNTGKTTIRNIGIKGMNIDGTVVNEKGLLEVDNRAGALNMSKDAQLINRKADINIKSSSAAAMNLDGSIYNLEGDNINLENTNVKGGIVIGENALLNTQGDVNINNVGSKGLKVQGVVGASEINIDNKDSHIFLGKKDAAFDPDADANLNALGNVNINLENGSLLNAGTKNTLILTEGDLNIKVDNGKIGFETGTSGGGYTYGPSGEQVDTTKSINIDVAGKINAQTNDTQGTTGDYVINLASQGTDMNIDHIKADGRVILLADFDEENQAGSILNASTDPTKANIEAKGLSLISSGSIGTDDSVLNINDTNYAYKSDYQAIGDINLKSLDDQYNKADVRYIISNTGKINAEFTGLARVKDTYSGSDQISVTNRTGRMNLVNNGTTPNTGLTYYTFRGEEEVMPIQE